MSNTHPESGPAISRRKVLRIAGVGLMGIVAGGVGITGSRLPLPTASSPIYPEPLAPTLSPDLFPREPHTRSVIPVSGFKPVSYPESLDFSKEGVLSQFEQLATAPIVDPNIHAQAVEDNVRGIVLDLEAPEGMRVLAGLTGLRFNKAGLYLTVAHGTTPDHKAKGGFVADFHKGEVLPIKQYLRADGYDLAIIHAPTGEEDDLVTYMRATLARVRPGENLFQYALNMGHPIMRAVAQVIPPTTLRLGIDTMTGYVDNPPEEFKTALPSNPLGMGPLSSIQRDRIRIRGMQPFAGASGAPIINAGGAVVGVESSYYAFVKPESIADYAGATIALLEHIREGIGNSILYNFN